MAARLKCPYCAKELGYDEEMIALVRAELSTHARIAPKLQEPSPWEKLTNKVKEAISSDEKKLEEANKWIDIKCPNCSRTYQYNTETQIVKP